MDVYGMLRMLAQAEEAFLHELDDPRLDLEAALKEAESQHLKYAAIMVLVEQNKPVVHSLCAGRTKIGATGKPK